MTDYVALTTELLKNKGLENFVVLTAHFFEHEYNYASILSLLKSFLVVISQIE